MDTQGPLLPALKPHDWKGREAVICRPLMPDQESAYMPVVAYGHDLPHTFQFLSRKQFPEGDFSQQLKLIEQAALRNLGTRELVWKTEEVQIGPSKQLRMVVAGEDYFAAERILDAVFIKQAHGILKADMLIVAAPRRGMLLATSAKQPKEMLERFGAAVSAQYHRADSPPISPLLFVAVEGRLVGMLKGMEDAARDAMQEEAREAPEVFCNGMVTTDKTTRESVINIFAGGRDLERVARTVQNAFIKMIQEYGGEKEFGGKVHVHLVPDLTPKTESLDESMASLESHLTEVAREFKFKTPQGQAIEVTVRYGRPDSPGTGPGAAASPRLREEAVRSPMEGPLIGGGPGLPGPVLPLDPKDAASLVQALLAGDPDVRSQAGQYLQELRDPESIEPLVKALSFPDAQVRRLASGVLILFGASAVEPLLPAYDDHDNRTRRAVVRILGEIAAPRGVDILIQALLDSDGEVRAAAALGLGAMKDVKSFVPLLSALLDEEADVQVAAAVALGDWGDPRAAPALALRLMEAEVESVRVAFRQVLDKLGKDPAELEGLLPRVRSWAVEEGKKRRYALFKHALALANHPQTFVDLAKKAPPEWVDEVIAAVIQVRGDQAQIGACLKIAAVLQEPYLTRAIEQGVALAEKVEGGKGVTSGPYFLASALRTSGLPEDLQMMVADQAIRLAREKMAEAPHERKWAEVMIRLGHVGPDGLTPALRSKLVGAALDAARGIADASDQAKELMELVRRVAERPSQLSVMGEALAAVMTIPAKQRRSDRLNWLATSLPYDLKGEMLAIARGLESPAQRAEALGGLARNFPEPLRSEAIREALAVAPTIEDRIDRVNVLSRLAEYVSEEQRTEIIEAARRLPDPGGRAVTLGGLSRYLPEKQGLELMNEALGIAWRIDDMKSRNDAVTILASHLMFTLKADIGTLLEGEKGRRARSSIWSSIGGGFAGASMRGELRELLLEFVGIVSQPLARASALSTVGVEFTGGKSQECIRSALDAARVAPDDWEKACVIAALAWYVPRKEQPAILEEARGIVRRLDNHALCMSLKRELLGDKRELLVAALQLLERDPPDARGFDITDVAMGVIELLEKDGKKLALQEAMAAARGIEDDWLRARAMVALSDEYPKELQAEAVVTAQEVADPVRRAGVLTALAKQRPTGVTSGMRIEKAALAAARSVQDPVARVRAQAELFDIKDFIGERRLAREVLDEVRSIADEFHRGKALEALAGHLPEELRIETLRIVQGMPDEAYRSSAFSEIAKHMPSALHPELLATALRFEDPPYRVRALAPLTAILEGEMRERAFQSALAAARDYGMLLPKIDMFLDLAEKAPPELKSRVMQQAIPVMKGFPDVRRRIELLESLAKHAPGEDQVEILAASEAAEAELAGGEGGGPAEA